jgi:hypothetical protein
MVRAWCGLCFAVVATLEERFGDTTLLLVALVLSVSTGVVTYFAWKMTSALATGLLAPDVLALALLVPVLASASGVLVADQRLSDRGPYFLLAALATLGALGLIELLAVIGNANVPRQLALAALPAALCVAAVLGGGERFSAGAIHEGLSVAWMVAAVVTLVDGLVAAPPNVVPVVAFTLIAVTIVLAGSSGGATSTITARNAAIAYFTTAAAGGSLLLLPRIARSFASQNEPGTSDASD